MQRAFKDFIKTDFIGKLALAGLILGVAVGPAAAQKQRGNASFSPRNSAVCDLDSSAR